MAYTFYDLGLKGKEIKRRLELLKNIYGENSIATNETVS
jgi:hypothetical protein